MTMPSAKPTPMGLNENRKASKPLIEKRRRARINNSLAQLKSMVVESATNNQPPNGKPPKLEKADILEMTVTHLKKIHHGLMKVPDDEKYMAGFSYCMKEVRHFIESNIDDDSKSRVLHYLNCFANKILLSGANHISMTDLETGMDDSSCSSNSRSETPSSTFNDCSPMDYHSCSPCPETQPDSSTALTNRTHSPVSHSQYENSKWIYASPDTSANRTHSSRICANNLPSNCEREESSHGYGPLNLSYHNSKSNVDRGQQNDVRNSLQINYSNKNVDNQVYNDHALNRPIIMPNVYQENASESVWRPW
ncbi:transcription factor HES-7.1 isoform X1 [Parasteatoda tepidariorum]|uniref:transcription factor HES-7.1 isoform X1 n=2 Tax=Parasteatoda tepidariorum TaxID=114398 RepID=UPI00077FE4A5|nr:transcription factor HES-7.1 isoform X1 [Parasteatoda tepidariorum]